MSLLDPVITLSHYDDGQFAAQNAIDTVLRCREHFAPRIHIVRAGFDPERHMDKAQLQQLADAKIELVLHGAQLQLDKLPATLALAHIPCDLHAQPSAVERLLETMHEAKGRKTHFAVSTNLEIQPLPGNSWLSLFPRVMLYGFLNLVLFFDFLLNIALFGKHHRECDLRVETLSLTWPNTLQRTRVSYWRPFSLHSCVSGACYAEDDAVQRHQLQQHQQPLNFVLRTIYTHPTLGSVLWWPAFIVYYALFSYPWWNHLLEAPPTVLPNGVQAWVSLSSSQWLSLVFYRDLWNGSFWFLWYLWHVTCVAIVVMRYQAYPARTTAATVLLYPFYVAAFPIVYWMGWLGIKV